MINEIGSEFWIEREPDELFKERDGVYCLSGRTAIDLILQDILRKSPVKRVAMPSWCCDSMLVPFLAHGIDVLFYDYGCTNPSISSGQVNETTDIFYLTNYFGYENTLPVETVRKIKELGSIILYDRTHSFLIDDAAYQELADYSFASIRKWMGVIGGAVVDGLSESPALKDCPFVPIKEVAMKDKFRYLMGDATVKKDEFLASFGEFGDRLAAYYCNYEMDDLSYTLYKQTDIQAMKQRRRENAAYIHEHLKGLQFVYELTEGAVPLFVPVLFETKEKRDHIRRKLIENQIYCPVHWPQPVQIPTDYRVNDIVDRELSLICDQRYGLPQIKREIEIINGINMKTILVTGIGGLTPRSITGIIRENHPDYHIIGVDVNKKAVGFFMKGLLDEYYVCPRCTDPAYFPWIEKLVAEKHIDYAFVQPESEIVEWGDYYDKHGKFPVPVFMGSKLLSVSLKDKSIMADLLEGTDFIPKTIKVTQDNPRYEDVEKEIGFPCWIRATEGTGGLGSLKLEDMSSYKSWLFINSRIPEFTVSEFLTGRHLANEMLYYNGEYVKGAALECAEYVMANTAPSHVTGNTAFGRFLNEDRINKFCDDCIKYLEKKLNVPAHGILSFDLKEDKDGNMKVTEVNIRHMAYAGVMAHVGFDLIEDTIKIMEDGNADRVERAPFYHYEKPYIFLRDVDVEPIILESEEVFDKVEKTNI